ncbi:class I SAM-dependent methyltransferase [Egibacter rhizosphaerae]|uniref:Class I SAM-dependent methyltransferase n=1 Tax=Egibacter rhizosphaerae TaxID=1670831 RepID=A0A411YBS3_9ACTN|nr:class I SAM-dependent methyltransferase [Egibacter rhizosphaerae]QBI18628.1 class I SAM-dependent methyltransferase [Egibacter rhizosphaerae]
MAPEPAPDPTVAYFDEHCPEYSTGRLAWAGAWIAEHYGPGASLADIGCGAGNILAYLRDRTGIEHVAGIDPSSGLLALAQDRLGCPTYPVSVLDPELEARIPERFDVVVAAAVLHHLVGGTRRDSRELARTAVDRALRLVRPGGHLVIVEPVFSPRAPMALLFHTKRAVARFTDRRVALGDYWRNIGPPVVSYLTDAQLAASVRDAGGEVVAHHVEPREVGRLLRLAGIRSRHESTFVVRRPAEDPAGA